MKRGLVLFGFLLLLMFSISFISAGWLDQAPVQVNPNPGLPNAHANSGHARMVRIDNVSIVLALNAGREATYRSTDNGQNWEEIDTDIAFSGSLISGANNFVYHFYRSSSNIRMVKFQYNDTSIPAPVQIYSPSSGGGLGAYNMLNSIVDADGTLYVATHWDDNSDGRDEIYVLKSEDEGNTWQGPYLMTSDFSGSYGGVHMGVMEDNTLISVFMDQVGTGSRFGISNDGGETWTVQNICSVEPSAFNPHVLPVGNNTIFVFAQGDVNAGTGLLYKRSDDKGQTWGSWTLIDGTCGYGDPGAALGADGQTIYVAYRSSNGTGITTGTCGDQSKSRMAVSNDLGQTWSFPDNYYAGERTGTRNNIRYQTWYNYGGPIEWMWLQYINGGTALPTFYDINVDEEIYNFGASPTPDTTPPVRSNGAPSGTLSAGTTSTSISLTTNEAATCRYSTNSGTAYASMANTFSSTGSTSHSTTVSGLTNGSSYTYYVRCLDGSTNANTNDYPISFSVNQPEPFCGDESCDEGETCLNCETDCGACPVIANPGDLNGDNKVDINDLFIIFRHIFRIEINNSADVNSDGNVNIFDLVITARYFGRQYGTDNTAPSIISARPVNGTILSAGTTHVIMGVETNEMAVCKYTNVTGGNFTTNMTSFYKTGGVFNSINLTGLSDGTNYTYYIQCEDETGNLNSTDYVISFGVGGSGGSGGGNLVLSYGYEGATGWSSDPNDYSSPAPGYIHTQPTLDMFDDHRYSVIVTEGGGDCGGSAYEGQYFLHVQTSPRAYDPCLGRIADAVNERNFIGRPNTDSYPTGSTDNTHFGTVLAGETDVTLRFYFRTTGDWTSANGGYRPDGSLNPNLDAGGGMKWTRWGIGRDYHGDANNILILVGNDLDSLDPYFDIGDDSGTTWGEMHNRFNSGINWQDGNWHSYIQHSHRIDATHFEVSLWLDDWNMENTPFATTIIGVPDAGNGGYYFLGLPSNNWCASYPQNIIGVDMDQVEVWAGLPG
ncbi:MAG: dockerin type I domain-containing protein [Nanoarchaeota archaeon]